MTPPRKLTDAQPPGKPIEAQPLPLKAQTEPTAGRDKVREQAYPVHAPRQSKRSTHRTSKG